MGDDRMILQRIHEDLTVCRLDPAEPVSLNGGFYFLSRTDEELSLVCPTADVPANALKREDGWRAFRVAGTLDFSLVGILAKLTAILAAEGIGLFAVSTYNTDYILVKRERFDDALAALSKAGYDID